MLLRDQVSAARAPDLRGGGFGWTPSDPVSLIMPMAVPLVASLALGNPEDPGFAALQIPVPPILIGG